LAARTTYFLQQTQHLEVRLHDEADARLAEFATNLHHLTFYYDTSVPRTALFLDRMKLVSILHNNARSIEHLFFLRGCSTLLIDGTVVACITRCVHLKEVGGIFQKVERELKDELLLELIRSCREVYNFDLSTWLLRAETMQAILSSS
jgi:hypothetical protein